MYHILFTRDCWPSSELIYCDHCFGCKNCFGCIGLRKKEFCIFNKQYDKKTYFQQVARILDFMQETGEWGEFFPIKTSPFAYNETVAHECFPLQKSEAESHGYRWYE